ncbi:MAG: ribonuclease P protein component [Candidatus Eisenbacteria bacterium]|uniref:Ribonuclease P protein component n=1 Tax=Eiseniibacteriota bacterium TaxID=2212470 RepID=A0A538S918_UNCEI|nr:MAG: ribonuclease P protein component [Candidatus Eisenbacteria bacterium]
MLKGVDAGTELPARDRSGLAAASARSVMPSQHPERLGREHRLRSGRDFVLVKQDGRPLRGRHCLMLVAARPGEPTRVGFIASKKGVGGAVERNRRRLREIVRRRWPRVARQGYWFVIVAFRSAIGAPHQELADDIERLLAEAGALAPIGSLGHP